MPQQFSPDASRKIIKATQLGLRGDRISGHRAQHVYGGEKPLLVSSGEPTVNTPGVSWIDYEKGVLMYNYAKEVTIGEGEEQVTTEVPTRGYIGTYRGDLAAAIVAPGSLITDPLSGSEYFIEVDEALQA